jgi:hypothetical protein
MSRGMWLLIAVWLWSLLAVNTVLWLFTGEPEGVGVEYFAVAALATEQARRTPERRR